MRHFINLKDIPAKDLRRILADAKKRKFKRKKLNTLEIDKDAPLKGKLLVQMFEKSRENIEVMKLRNMYSFTIYSDPL